MKISFFESFLSDDECDFLINYYHENYQNDTKTASTWGLTRAIYMPKTPFFHVKKSLIRRKYLKEVSKKFPSLKLQFDQLVHWLPGSCSDLHYDRDHPTANPPSYNDWTSVCYLNDNFNGGDTVLDGNYLRPKKGRLLVFPSKKILHGVSPVHGDRYTHIAWWQEK